MKTCCALHNIILVYDGIDISNWESVNWGELEPEMEENQDIIQQPDVLDIIQEENIFVESTDYLIPLTVRTERIDIRTGKRTLKEALQQHFAWAFRKGEVK